MPEQDDDQDALKVNIEKKDASDDDGEQQKSGDEEGQNVVNNEQQNITLNDAAGSVDISTTQK